MSALCLLHGAPVSVVECEWAGGGEADVKVLVADLVDPGIGVVVDVDALESEEEDLCEADVVECVRDLDLVLEREGGRVWLCGEGGSASAVLGCLPCECDGGDVTGPAAALHVGGSSRRHLRGEKKQRRSLYTS